VDTVDVFSAASSVRSESELSAVAF